MPKKRRVEHEFDRLKEYIESGEIESVQTCLESLRGSLEDPTAVEALDLLSLSFWLNHRRAGGTLPEGTEKRALAAADRLTKQRPESNPRVGGDSEPSVQVSALAEKQRALNAESERRRAVEARVQALADAMGANVSQVPFRASMVNFLKPLECGGSWPGSEYGTIFTQKRKKIAFLAEPYGQIDKTTERQIAARCKEAGLEYEIDPALSCWNPGSTSAILYWRSGQPHPIKGLD